MKEIIASLMLIVVLYQSNAVSVESTGYIFLGDSRTVGMNIVVDVENNESQFVVAEVGEGYKWMESTALPEIYEIIDNHPEYTDWVLITNLGVNDLYNCQKYVDAYEQLSDVFDIYVVSVNPCDGTSSYLNSKIESFNETMEQLECVEYIDTHGYLYENGFGTVDGLHYDRQTYQKIYDFITNEVIVEEPVNVPIGSVM